MDRYIRLWVVILLGVVSLVGAGGRGSPAAAVTPAPEPGLALIEFYSPI